jgi:CRP/FNR family cyclic AMP-dependent transcriptional regulator
MLKNLIDRIRAATGMSHDHQAAWKLDFKEPKTSIEMAADMLRAPTALMQLTAEQAQTVVKYMQPLLIPEGTVIFQEGDTDDTGYLLLIIGGEVTVETLIVSRQTPDTLTVLGPGSLIGEMALFDGAARWATCTAASLVRCAVLSRDAIESLTRSEPTVAAHLMTAIGHCLAERLRQSDEKVRLYSHLVRTMQKEIDTLMR